MHRRLFLTGAAGASALALMGHSPYRQWYRYRAQHTVIATDGADAGSFPLGERLATYIERRRPELKAVAGPAQNPRTLLSLLLSRQLDLALLRAEDAYHGLHGTGPYSHLKIPLRALAGLAPEYLYLLVPTSSPIRTVADLREHRVGVVDNGGRARAKAERVVAAGGLDPEGSLRWVPMTAEASVGALTAGEIHACFLETPSAAPGLALPRRPAGLVLRAVPHGEAVDALAARHGPIFFKAVPRGEAGSDLQVGGQVLGEVRMLVCREDYPAERARTVVQALDGWSELAPAGTPLPIPRHAALGASRNSPA